MTVAVPEKPTTRIAIFDGIRGVAIVLVLLSHGWLLWPTEQIDRSPLLDAVFSNGDAAVSVFFVVGSFLATRNLLRLADGPSGLHPAVATLRRFVRLSGQTYLLLVTVVVVTVFDSSNTYAGTNLGKSVFTSATYTWNWYVRNDPAEARPDLGHLWYLSVDFQVFLLVLAAVCLMRHRRVRLVLVLSAMLVLMLWWRSHMYALDPAGTAVRTWARGDAPVAGALAASALPFVGRLVPYARAMAIGAAVLLLPVLYLTADVDRYFSLAGIALDALLVALVVGCTLAPPARPLRTVLGAAPLAFLGRHSLGLYLWHYPIFWFVARHGYDWHWESRTAVALTVTFAATFVSFRVVETRVRRLLDSSRWRDADQGVLVMARRWRDDRRVAKKPTGV